MFEKAKRSYPRQVKGSPGVEPVRVIGEHPDHSAHITRLNRVKGQIAGIEKMILERRYCPDIIIQLKAASAALAAVESEIFKAHLKGCVRSVFEGKDAFKSEEKIQEIIKIIFK